MKKAGKLIGKQEKRKEMVPGTENETAMVPKPKGRPRKDNLNITAPEVSRPVAPPPLDTSMPILLTDGTTELCRRSSRKKTMKFDIKEVLNIKTTPKIQIEARIDTNVPIPPEIPRRISICKQSSSSSNKPKSIIQDFVSISPPPPLIVAKKKPVGKASKKVESVTKDEPEKESPKVESPIPDQCSSILNDFMELLDDKKDSTEFQPKRRSVRLKTTIGGPCEDKRLLNSSVEKEITICESSNDSSASDKKKKSKFKLEESTASPSPVVSECSTDDSKEKEPEPTLKFHNKIITRRKTFKPLKSPCSPDPEPTLIPNEVRLTRRRATMFKTPSPVNVPELKKISKTVLNDDNLEGKLLEVKKRSKTPTILNDDNLGGKLLEVKQISKTPTILNDDNLEGKLLEVKKRSKTPTVEVLESKSINIVEIKSSSGENEVEADQTLEEASSKEKPKKRGRPKKEGSSIRDISEEQEIEIEISVEEEVEQIFSEEKSDVSVLDKTLQENGLDLLHSNPETVVFEIPAQTPDSKELQNDRSSKKKRSCEDSQRSSSKDNSSKDSPKSCKDSSRSSSKDTSKESSRSSSKDSLNDTSKSSLSDVPKDSPKSTSRSSLRDVTKDSLKDTSRSSSKDISKDSSRSSSKDTSRSSSKDNCNDSPKDSHRSSSKDNSRSSLKDVSKNTSRVSSKDVSSDSPKGTSRSSSKDSSRSSSKDTPRSSKYTSKDSPKDINRSSSKDVSRSSTDSPKTSKDTPKSSLKDRKSLKESGHIPKDTSEFKDPRDVISCRESSKSISKDSRQSSVKDNSRFSSKDSQRSSSKDSPRTKDITRSSIKDTPRYSSKDSPRSSKDTSKSFQRNSRKSLYKDVQSASLKNSNDSLESLNKTEISKESIQKTEISKESLKKTETSNDSSESLKKTESPKDPLKETESPKESFKKTESPNDSSETLKKIESSKESLKKTESPKDSSESSEKTESSKESSKKTDLFKESFKKTESSLNKKDTSDDKNPTTNDHEKNPKAEETAKEHDILNKAVENNDSKDNKDLLILECQDRIPKIPKTETKSSQKMKTFEDIRISENFAKIFREDNSKTKNIEVKQEVIKNEVISEKTPKSKSKVEEVRKSENESSKEKQSLSKSKSKFEDILSFDLKDNDKSNCEISKQVRRKTPSPTENEPQKKKKVVVPKPDIVKKKLKKSLEKGAQILQKVVESVKKSNILKRKKNSDIKIIRRRNSLPHLSKADRKLQLKAIRDTLKERKLDSSDKFESDSAIKLKNGLLKSLTEEDSSSNEKSKDKDSLLSRSYSTLVSSVELGDENAVDLLLESFQVKKKKKEAAKKKKSSEKEKSSDPLDDIEKFIAISENLLSKPENKENKDILVKKLFNEIKEFEANVKQEILAPPRRSHRLQTISKTVSKSSKGVVRDEKYSSEDYKMDLAELEAENAKFLKDMEERLTQFSVIRKSEYKCERIISKEAERMICDCYLNPDEEDSGAFGCGEDCLNRMLMIECGDDCVVGDRCTNRRFQNFMYSHCKVFRTEKKGFGIMADAEINPGDFIMEYVGEVINTEQFEGRREVYSKDKNAHYYFMALRSDSIIDATTRGNISRFINHSCEPNAETQKWTVNGELRIGFFCVKKILPGEEITFDYQFQRYGKEAQKCFCESENCRGWIGEEPDSDVEEEELEEEDEEDEEEEEVVEEESEADKIKEIEKPVIQIPEIVPVEEKIIEIITENKELVIPQPVPPPTEVVIDVPQEPLPVPAPSEVPVEVKPKVVAVKPKVPKKIKRKPQVLEDYDIIENVESLIRSGLKNQAQTLKLSRLMVRSKLLLTRIKILQIIQNGEMPCKRLFLDYHGLRFLHEWMVEIKEMDDEIDIDIFHLKMAFLNTLDSLPVCNKTVLKESGIWEVVQNWSETNDRSASPDEDSNESEPTEKTVFTKVNRLMEKWKDLPEVFKIPKKERIEQMKEHEREADRAFKILNITDEFSNQNKYRFNKIDFRKRSEQYSNRTNSMFSWSRTADARRKDSVIEKLPNDNLSKEQRREMFALKVKRDENEKRLAEENRMVDVRCKVFGLDPKLVDKSSLPYCLNNKTMEWYSQKKRKIEVPPSYASCPPPKKTKSTNPQDYRLPKMNLPADWKFAIDGFGRCYYFNKRLRISQWHQPITLKPIGSNSFIKLPTSVEKKDESDEEDAGSDLSGDETELWLASKNPNSLKDYITAKVERRRIKRNNFLVKERAISPRKEEDRLHNQVEMRKYKETKEKLRRRKEEKKRRKFLLLDPNSSVCQLPIQDYLLSSDDEDFATDDQQLNTTCPLIDKIVEEDKLVDEVEFIERHKPLKRHLSGGSRDKYEHRKRQKMDSSYKREASSSGRSSSSKHKSGEPLSKKAKERFRSDIGLFIMQNLIHYKKPTCGSGRITCADDFDHLTRKLTHYILTKESRHCGSNLEVTDSVKNKTREYIKKYMVKYGDVYTKPSGDPEFKEIPNIKGLLSILEEYERVENFDIYKL
ncbi:SETD2 family protein [Megaselia abdita]